MKRVKHQSSEIWGSPFKTAESINGLSTYVSNSKKRQIVISFDTPSQQDAPALLESKFPISSKIKELLLGIKPCGSPLRLGENLTFCRWLFGLANHGCTQFNETGVSLGKSISYSSARPMILFNNSAYFSILRFDIENQISYLDKVQNAQRAFCSSSGFFDSSFPHFVAASYFGKASEIWDIEKRVAFCKFDTEGATLSKGAGTSVIFFDKGAIKIFDIRSPFKTQENVIVDASGSFKEAQCTKISKEGYSLLASFDTGCVYYDLRKENKAQFENIKNPESLPIEQFASLNFQEQGDQYQWSEKLKTKNWLISPQKGFVADFTERTLNLYNFSMGKIEKSLHFEQKLLDVDINQELGSISTLVSTNEGTDYELAMFSLDLVQLEILDVSPFLSNNLGFIGQTGHLVLHRKGEFNVFKSRSKYFETSSEHPS